MRMPRSFPVFAVVFAVAYTIAYAMCVELNYPLFSYHPALNQFGWGIQQPLDGPVMFWYGWLATAGIAASAVALVASVLPEVITRRLWPGLAWLVPIGGILVFGYNLRNFFLQ
jgi:hypothetical protein